MLTIIAIIAGYWALCGALSSAAQLLRHLLLAGKATADRDGPKVFAELVKAPLHPAVDVWNQGKLLVDEIGCLVGVSLVEDSAAARRIAQHTDDQISDVIHHVSNIEVEVQFEDATVGLRRRLAHKAVDEAAAKVRQQETSQAS